VTLDIPNDVGVMMYYKHFIGKINFPQFNELTGHYYQSTNMQTAKTMLDGKRYLYVGFMCHQAVEKILKAYFTASIQQTPPFVH